MTKQIKTRGYSDATKDMLMAYSSAVFARFIDSVKNLPLDKQKEGHDEFVEEMNSAIALGQIKFEHSYDGPKKKYTIISFAFGRPVAPFEVSVYKLKKFGTDRQKHEAK